MANSPTAANMPSLTKPMPPGRSLNEVLTNRPDLTVDSPATIANITSGRVIVKNVGQGASMPSKLACNGGGSSGEGITAFVNYPGVSIPAIAAGASASVKVIEPSNSLTRLECTINNVPAEVITQNNTFKWEAPKLTAVDSLRAPSAIGGVIGGVQLAVPDLAFDDAAMRTSLSNLSSGTHLRVKNVGAATSKPAVATCTKTLDILMFDGSKKRDVSTRNVDVPALAVNAVFAETPDVWGPWENVSYDCTLDAANASGETNKANNKFFWQRQGASSAAIASPVTASAGAALGDAVRARAELAFDEPAMIQSIQRLPVIVKNVGGATSLPTTIGCDTSTQSYIDQQVEAIRNGGVPVGTGVYAANIPALAPGATHTVYTSATNVPDVRHHRCNGIRFPSGNNGGSGAISFLWKWQGINAAKPVSGAIDTPV
ncbi:MAG: hypothetical protein ACRDAM_02805, partial [Casimicrobium sp.]